jgi:phosphosulfolactate synthase (CoM biosynthesis protein A)
MGKRYLADVLETMGHHVDGLKFAGGSFSLFPEPTLRELLDLAHAHGVYVPRAAGSSILYHFIQF